MTKIEWMNNLIEISTFHLQANFSNWRLFFWLLFALLGAHVCWQYFLSYYFLKRWTILFDFPHSLLQRKTLQNDVLNLQIYGFFGKSMLPHLLCEMWCNCLHPLMLKKLKKMKKLHSEHTWPWLNTGGSRYKQHFLNVWPYIRQVFTQYLCKTFQPKSNGPAFDQ